MSTEKTGTPLSTIATVINNIIGAGLLALPYTFKRASLIPGIVSMIVTGILNMMSMIILARNCELSGARSYKELSEIAFGKRSATLIALVMAIYTLGSCVSYVVLLGDALPELIDNAGNPATDSMVNFWVNRSNILPICAALILLPLANHRNLSSLRFTATASFLCIVYTSMMIAVRAGSNPVSSSIVYVKEGPGVFVGIPITMVSFTMHYNTPRYWHELRNATIKSFTFIAFVCFGFALAIYELTATSGYVMFGNDTKGDILENFADDDGPAFAARIALVLVMFFSYPLAFNSYRASVTALLPLKWQQQIEQGITDYTQNVEQYKQRLRTDMESNQGDSDNPSSPSSLSLIGSIQTTIYSILTMFIVDWAHIILTVILVSITVIVAIALPQLEIILGYKGALGGTLIVYVFPACMYFIFRFRQRHGYEVNPNVSTLPGHNNLLSPVKPSSFATQTMKHNYQTPVPLLRSWSAGIFSVFSNTTKTNRSEYSEGLIDRDSTTIDRSYTPLLWTGVASSTPGSTVSDGNEHDSSHRTMLMDSPVPFTHPHPQLAASSPSEGHPGSSPSDGETLSRTTGDIIKELYTTSDGILAILFSLWGFTVMVFGTLTTAGVVD